MNNKKDKAWVKKAWVKFNKEMRIKGVKIPVAEYKGVFLFPKEKNFIPKKNDSYLVFLPIERYPFYIDGKSIYSVKIIKSEMMGEMRIFNNVFIPDNLFTFNNKNKEGEKIRVIVRGPDKRGGHKTSLLRIATAGNNNNDIKEFIKKNLLVKKMWTKRNGIIEIVVEPLEDFDYLKNGFLKKLSNQIKFLNQRPNPL